MLDLHTIAGQVKINIAIELLYRLEPIGALIQRKACSALYGNLFVFSPFWSPSLMAGFILVPINSPSPTTLVCPNRSWAAHQRHACRNPCKRTLRT